VGFIPRRFGSTQAGSVWLRGEKTIDANCVKP
jgi:hypothetical protein